MSHSLENIREGMTVRDSAGDRIGTVDWVKMTDEDPDTAAPETVTEEPALETDHTLVDDFLAAFREDDVPEPLREQLMRKGFVRMDADGFFKADRYVLPEQIAAISGDDVRLNVRRDDLIKQHG